MTLVIEKGEIMELLLKFFMTSVRRGSVRAGQQGGFCTSPAGSRRRPGGPGTAPLDTARDRERCILLTPPILNVGGANEGDGDFPSFSRSYSQLSTEL